MKRTGGFFEWGSEFDLTVKRRCELLGVGRWRAYQKLNEPDIEALAFEEQVKRRIDCWHTVLPCAGVRKLRKLLQSEDGLPVGRKLIRRLMDEMGVYAVYPKPNLSKCGKERRVFPYLLRNKAIDFPNQAWAIDITYVPMRGGHMYLTAIIDWHSRFIIGWELSDTLDTAPVIEAVEQAMERHGVPGIINSDQGSQFTSDVYVSLLKANGIRQSMDGKARWVDNVIIERWFRSLKTEYVYINEYATPRELRRGIGGYVRDYNNIRPHESLGYATPAAVYQAAFSSNEVA